MSEELQNQVNALTVENNTLKQQLVNNTSGVHSLMAQLDAHRQQMNESIGIGLQLRTNVIILQKNNAELLEKLKHADKRLVELEAQINSGG